MRLVLATTGIIAAFRLRKTLSCGRMLWEADFDGRLAHLQGCLPPSFNQMQARGLVDLAPHFDAAISGLLL
jgi:hypothetical protein